jgi:protein-L-isoaspartate(D-aspartate) O-methyltransferase
VPLRWRGQTQSVALVLGEDGILRSDTVFLCGFVTWTTTSRRS